MATIDRTVRRQRILKGGEDRLALITGRLQDLPPSPQSLSPDAAANFTAQSPPLVSRDRAPESRLFCRPQDKLTAEDAQPNQNGGLACRTRKESFLHRHEAGNKSWSVSGFVQLITALLNLFKSISSKQLSFVLAATEQSRMVLSITSALLVLMSHFRFPIVGCKIARTILLFRSLIVLLLTDTALILTRLLVDMKRGEKDGHKLTISDGYDWIGDAGRAVEVSLMVHDVLKALFMDFTVYFLIIICGFCLAS